MPPARFRSVLSLLLALATLCTFLPCASAEAQDAVTPRWSSAEVAILELMEEYEVYDTGVALAYYNTVTGEEYYLNADRYMDAASLYKVPLNMVFAERVANGELDPEGNIGVIPYRTLMEETLIYSSNDMAAVLIAQLNSYYNYRRTIAPYMGEDPDTVDYKYYENNFFTPRQMLTCLKLLYNEPERFPSIYETMQKAHPDEYFCRDEHRYTIAHKYGWNEEDGVLHLNDCAIIPTQDPILIVLFTSGINRQGDFLTAFCTRCIDYTESVTSAREAGEEAERLASETAAAVAEADEGSERAAAEQLPLEQPNGTGQEDSADLSPNGFPDAGSARSPAEQTITEVNGSSADSPPIVRLLVILSALVFVCLASLVSFILRLRAGKHGAMLLSLIVFLLILILLVLAFRMFFIA